MNTLDSILADVSDDNLKDMVIELKSLYREGILGHGKVRDLATTIAVSVGVPYGDALSIVQTEVLRRAAFKWTGV